MSRIRTIKPEFWSDEKVVECSTNARLLFIGLWNFCDDCGRHSLSPKQIKALVFPADDFSLHDILGMIDELSTNGLISIYEVENKKYFYVIGWKHQRIDRPQEPRCPAPFVDHSSNDRGPLATEGIREGKGRDQEPSHPSGARHGRESDAENLGATAPQSRRTKPTRAKVRSQIAENAQPDERQRADAREAGLTAELFRTEWRKFRDHHQAKGSLMADWAAAWRTWLGNVHGFQPRAGPATSPKKNPYYAAARQAMEAMNGQTDHDPPEDRGNRSPGAFEPSSEDRDGAIDEIVAH